MQLVSICIYYMISTSTKISVMSFFPSVDVLLLVKWSWFETGNAGSKSALSLLFKNGFRLKLRSPLYVACRAGPIGLRFSFGKGAAAKTSPSSVIWRFSWSRQLWWSGGICVSSMSSSKGVPPADSTCWSLISSLRMPLIVETAPASGNNTTHWNEFYKENDTTSSAKKKEISKKTIQHTIIPHHQEALALFFITDEWQAINRYASWHVAVCRAGHRIESKNNMTLSPKTIRWNKKRKRYTIQRKNQAQAAI